jgi:hypothetical protein
LAPLFGALNLDAHVHDKGLEFALEWFKRRGADTVADLRELPADALKAALQDLVDRLVRLQPQPSAAVWHVADLTRSLSCATGPGSTSAWPTVGQPFRTVSTQSTSEGPVVRMADGRAALPHCEYSEYPCEYSEYQRGPG